MSRLGARIALVAVLVAFFILLPFIFTGLLLLAVLGLIVLAIAGLLFYIRVRLALRRFRKAVELAQKTGQAYQASRQAGRQAGGQAGRQAGSPGGGAGRSGRGDGRSDVIEADFKVKDEP